MRKSRTSVLQMKTVQKIIFFPRFKKTKRNNSNKISLRYCGQACGTASFANVDILVQSVPTRVRVLSSLPQSFFCFPILNGFGCALSGRNNPTQRQERSAWAAFEAHNPVSGFSICGPWVTVWGHRASAFQLCRLLWDGRSDKVSFIITKRATGY